MLEITVTTARWTFDVELPATERLVTLPTGATIPLDMIGAVRLGVARDIGVTACRDWLKEAAE